MNHEHNKSRYSPVVLIFVYFLLFTLIRNQCTGADNDPPLIFLRNTISFHNPSQSFEPQFKSDADSIIIPLKRAGRLFLIEATIDGVDGNLVFDTGAGGLVINSTYFRNHVKTGSANSSGITGAVGKVYQITIAKMEFANLLYENMQADVADLGHIENNRNVKILGLIGFALVRNLEIVIDARNSELRLYRIDDSGKRTGAGKKQFIADHHEELDEKNDILFLSADIAGKTLHFCFDTGAETNVLNSYANKKVLNTITITRRKVLRGAGSAGSEVLFGRMNEFMFGSRKLGSMETIVTNLNALSEVYGRSTDGMLGCTFMENGIICINFVKKQFSIRYWKGGER